MPHHQFQNAIGVMWQIRKFSLDVHIELIFNVSAYPSLNHFNYFLLRIWWFKFM